MKRILISLTRQKSLPYWSWLLWMFPIYYILLSSSTTRVPQSSTLVVVIAVHGALDHFEDCLGSLERQTTPLFALIVDDCSAEFESATLVRMMARSAIHYEILNPGSNKPIRYTKAVNFGIDKAMQMRSPYICLMNSDVVVPSNALKILVDDLETSKFYAIGPITNAATWQSVPYSLNNDSSWNLNLNLLKFDVEYLQQVAENIPVGQFQAPSLGGFLIILKRETFIKVGKMNDKISPNGYGEEIEFAFRCRKRGLYMAVDPNVFVLHKKGRSYMPEETRSFTRETSNILKARFPSEWSNWEKDWMANEHMPIVQMHFRKLLSR